MTVMQRSTHSIIHFIWGSGIHTKTSRSYKGGSGAQQECIFNSFLKRKSSRTFWVLKFVRMRLLKQEGIGSSWGRGRIRTLINKGIFACGRGWEGRLTIFHALSPSTWYSKTISNLKSFPCSERGTSTPGMRPWRHHAGHSQVPVLQPTAY